MYTDAFEEAQRIIRISDEVRITLEKVAPDSPDKKEEVPASNELLSSSKLAKSLNMSTDDFMGALLKSGYIEDRDGQKYLTELGQSIGGKHVQKSRFGPYFKWPSSFNSRLLNATED